MNDNLQSENATPADGWITLFDGSSMDAWRGYRQDALPEGWVIEDSAMVMTAPAPGGDIVTREEFDNFELELDYRVPEGGNSGIMFHVTEDHDNPWETGPEMQVLDNAEHPDGAHLKNTAGSNYDVHAPSEDVTNPSGEWNHVRLVVNGPHVEHWLNGVKIVEYDMWTDEWRELVADSKWASHPDYGMRKTGLIDLQGDHTSVSYRNVRIRRL
jgi:3-keto-disaccharide hydrolase